LFDYVKYDVPRRVFFRAGKKFLKRTADTLKKRYDSKELICRHLKRKLSEVCRALRVQESNLQSESNSAPTFIQPRVGVARFFAGGPPTTAAAGLQETLCSVGVGGVELAYLDAGLPR
jgi:hypothetical protein